MSNKSRTATFGIGVLLALLALAMLAVPGWATALVIVLTLPVAAGLAAVANPGQRPAQLTVYDR